MATRPLLPRLRLAQPPPGSCKCAIRPLPASGLAYLHISEVRTEAWEETPDFGWFLALRGNGRPVCYRGTFPGALLGARTGRGGSVRRGAGLGCRAGPGETPRSRRMTA